MMKRSSFIFILLALLLCVALNGCKKQEPVSVQVQRLNLPETWWRVEGLSLPEEEHVKKPGEVWELPARWDNRLIDRTADIKNQGSQGTCWAFASLSAIESLLLPEQETAFSVDHMSMNHGYSMELEEGGNYTMALSYLAGWKGPVYEEDDPYDDGVTNVDAPVQAHLQEAWLLKNDVAAIKEAVLMYGAVQSSLYADKGVLGEEENTSYYSQKTASYYYDGPVQYNHDVLIIGWDDTYSREQFATLPPGDGAFICQNSWGEEFGENGFFYVSYYDTTIAQNTLVYTRMDALGVYDRQYQYDEFGWVGQAGYHEKSAWGANVFTALGNEAICAAGFYTTDVETEYQVYVVLDPDCNSFDDRILVAEGKKAYAGYHTIDFEEDIAVTAGQRFAIILYVTAPEADMPLAAEFRQEDGAGGTKNVTVGLGESYISSSGISWQDAGQDLECNLCIKAFAREEN